ncbi:MAG: succinylglutamate desuccinylase/aspartoacylase family protein [Nitrososphaerota archaeon]|nr:succinylglutamate desuccinylase/aspartoacylase family protein [Nitrososphaerota archaeon]
MTASIQIGDVKSSPGHSVHGSFKVAERAASSIELPISIIQGKSEGPTLVIVAGEHGCEYSGIVAAVKLAHELNASEMMGTVIILPLANPVAFDTRSLFVNPIDQVNPYGAYPGDPGATVTFQIAHKILNEVALKGDAVVHLHGADYNEALVPFNYVPITGNGLVDSRSSQLASCFPVSYHLNALPAAKSNSVPPVGTTYAVTADGTLYWEVATRGIPATMLEAGKEGKADKETVSIHYDGLINVMKHLGILAGTPRYHRSVKTLKNPVLVANRRAGLFIPKTEYGDVVKRGQALGEIWNFRGEVIETIKSPIDGMVVCRINFAAADSYPTQTQPYLFYITEVE